MMWANQHHGRGACNVSTRYNHHMLPLFAQYDDLPQLRAACLACTNCPLHQTRDRVVFGAGHPQASLMLIGQGPSQTDDRTGRPYSGPAGDYLDKALAQADLTRDSIWITNVTKCLASKTGKDGRPELRPPRKAEMAACRPWLEEELILIQPAAIVAIGGPAAQALIDAKFNLTEQRGRWYDGPGGIPTLAIYQPTYLVRLSKWDRKKAVSGWRELVADMRSAAQRVIDAQ
ncbi:MAG: uracil-DNA glycosylase [Chloroflexota bacterium]|nr:uracil-DNA glycosylase [Chloroflexota bacterium]